MLTMPVATTARLRRLQQVLQVVGQPGVLAAGHPDRPVAEVFQLGRRAQRPRASSCRKTALQTPIEGSCICLPGQATKPVSRDERVAGWSSRLERRQRRDGVVADLRGAVAGRLDRRGP